MIMKLSPIAAFGAMAYTIGNFGIGSLQKLGFLMGSRLHYYVLIYCIRVLGTIAKIYGFNVLNSLLLLKKKFYLY